MTVESGNTDPKTDPGKKDDKGAGDGGKKDDAGKGEDKKFSQADVDRIVEERLAREKRKAEDAAETARKKAEDDALAKRQEFEQLANARQARIAELEPKLGEVTTLAEEREKRVKDLEALIAADIETEMKQLNLPDAVKELLAGKDIAERRAWMTKHRAEFGKPDVKGVTKTPDKDANALAADDKAAKEQTAAFYQGAV